ncbi:MAG TPA: helix-turn-helix domain-containing protein, partial [Burkholderiaceae bacterium]|nr:helix-turn-helix domain-containing protein [Burkholderiaceae bacterium]
GWRATGWLFAVQRALPPAFALLAAITAGRNWRADLVEPRRRLRAFVIVTGIGYALVMVALRAQSPRGQLTGLAATLDIALPLLIVAVIASQLLRLTDSDVLLPAAAPAPRPLADLERVPVLPLPVQSPAAPVPPDPAEQRLAEALRRAMVDERAYRTEDLTVAVLAARLAVPEYRLRRVINQRLGHRNFNAFVNGFRLDEARAALADPAKRELPILTIALDAGFQSIGPFNRAFKAATGLTPGEFRKEKRADS